MIETVAVTGSTNADLVQRLADGEPVGDGCWLVARRQTAGRGRLGRAWSDGLGNFMGSTTVRLLPGDPSPSTLALATGLAVHQATGAHLAGPHQAMLKWPNDVLVDGAKLAGILLERSGDTVIVGIGVNLVQSPQLPDRPTCSLAQFAPAPALDDFAPQLAACFADQLAQWCSSGLPSLLARWQAAAHPVGTSLTVTDPTGQRVNGRFAGLDGAGALRLALADGTTRIVHAGDVSLTR